jgi:hypothetical protein
LPFGPNSNIKVALYEKVSHLRRPDPVPAPFLQQQKIAAVLEAFISQNRQEKQKA